MKKNLKVFSIVLLVLYLGSILFAINIYFKLEATQKDEIKNFIIYSINNFKFSKDVQYINNATIVSFFSLLMYLILILLASMNKYFQLLNILIIIFKGFSFGLTTSLFFSAYGAKGILFFLSYIFLKELIVLLFLIILILYSITNCILKDRFVKIEDVQSKVFIAFISILLSAGVVFIDRVVAPIACNLIK